MSLDREQTSDASRISSYPAGSPVISPSSTPSEQHSAPITAAVSTPLLRRCTALAAQARVELLTESRRSASAELEGVLAEIENWAPEHVRAPDSTMVALAAAALQDLQERMSQAAASTLDERLTPALAVLHSLMEPSPLRAMA